MVDISVQQINHLCLHCAEDTVYLKKLVVHFMLMAQLVFPFVHVFTNLSLLKEKMLNAAVKCITTLGLLMCKCFISAGSFISHVFNDMSYFIKCKNQNDIGIIYQPISQWKIPHRSTTTLNASENSVLYCP